MIALLSQATYSHSESTVMSEETSPMHSTTTLPLPVQSIVYSILLAIANLSPLPSFIVTASSK